MAMPMKPRPACRACGKPGPFVKSVHCSRACYRASMVKHRPMCAHCGTNQVRSYRTRFCSLKCAGKANRAAALARRRMCAYCKVKRVPKAAGVYCGKACSMFARSENPAFRRRQLVGWAKAKETQRAQYFARVRARLEECFQPLFDAHPDWSVDTRVAILKASVAMYSRSYRHGWQARGNRERRSA
jgi:hypothetical protein